MAEFLNENHEIDDLAVIGLFAECIESVIGPKFGLTLEQREELPLLYHWFTPRDWM